MRPKQSLRKSVRKRNKKHRILTLRFILRKKKSEIVSKFSMKNRTYILTKMKNRSRKMYKKKTKIDNFVLI